LALAFFCFGRSYVNKLTVSILLNLNFRAFFFLLFVSNCCEEEIPVKIEDVRWVRILQGTFCGIKTRINREKKRTGEIPNVSSISSSSKSSQLMDESKFEFEF